MLGSEQLDTVLIVLPVVFASGCTATEGPQPDVHENRVKPLIQDTAADSVKTTNRREAGRVELSVIYRNEEGSPVGSDSKEIYLPSDPTEIIEFELDPPEAAEKYNFVAKPSISDSR